LLFAPKLEGKQHSNLRCLINAACNTVRSNLCKGSWFISPSVINGVSV